MPVLAQALKSSAIAFASYDTDSEEMTVEFIRGKSYTLSGVPQDVYDRFVASSSPGRFFQDELKGQY